LCHALKPRCEWRDGVLACWQWADQLMQSDEGAMEKDRAYKSQRDGVFPNTTHILFSARKPYTNLSHSNMSSQSSIVTPRYADGVTLQDSESIGQAQPDAKVQPDEPVLEHRKEVLAKLGELERRVAPLSQGPTFASLAEDGTIAQLRSLLDDTRRLVPPNEAHSSPNQLIPTEVSRLLAARHARAMLVYWHSTLRATYDPSPEHDNALEQSQRQYHVANQAEIDFKERAFGMEYVVLHGRLGIYEGYAREEQAAWQRSTGKRKREVAPAPQAESVRPVRRSKRICGMVRSNEEGTGESSRNNK
jgi:hypothetical protein